MAQDGGAGGVETFLNANEEIVAITEARMARYRKLMRPFNDYTRLWRTGSKRKFCKQANRLLRSLEYPERLVLYPVRQSMRFRATPVAVHEDDEQQVQSPPVLNENVVFPQQVQPPIVLNEDVVFPQCVSFSASQLPPCSCSPSPFSATSSARAPPGASRRSSPAPPHRFAVSPSRVRQQRRHHYWGRQLLSRT